MSKQIRLTEQQKKLLMETASKDLFVIDLKRKLKIYASYDRVRDFLVKNNLPYRKKGELLNDKKTPQIPSGMFNVFKKQRKMDHLKKQFIGNENDLKEAAYILMKLRNATKDYKRSYMKIEQNKMKNWEERADKWIEKNIKY